MKDGVNATPLPTVNTTGYIDHAAFLGTINPDTNEISTHLFHDYLNIYNNYFKAPWMPDRIEANPNELNQDDACYFFFQAEDGIRDRTVTGVQTCALPIYGFTNIMQGDVEKVRHLTIDDVSRIHFRGGSHLGIARANPTKSPELLEAAVVSLLQIGRASCRERGQISEGVGLLKER